MAEHGWFYEAAEEDEQTNKVGRLRPNAWGLYDMHGNASEWTLDAYDPGHYAKFAGKTVPAAQLINWPTKLYPRVLRGGSWWTDEAEGCRSAARLASDEAWRDYDPNTPKSPWWLASEDGQAVGFRLVRPAVPPPRSEWPRYWDADVEQVRKDADRRIDKEGKGERGLVDPELPDAIGQLGTP
jgi:formylglycine-generating enzyme required for sulfatase activity